MDAHVEQRIRTAMRRGSERLSFFSSGRRRFIKPSDAELERYGPQATGDFLLKELERLGHATKPSLTPQPTAPDVSAWRELLADSPLVNKTVNATEEEDQLLHLAFFSPVLREILEERMRTNEWLILKIAGALLQQEAIRKKASRRLWDQYGFYDIYEDLQKAHDAEAFLRQDALATVARLAAYTICMIEEYSYVGEIGGAKRCLEALRQGAIPVAYEKQTKTVYIGNWYNL